MKSLLRDIMPSQANHARISKQSCYYLHNEETVLIVKFYEKEINGESCLIVRLIKTGSLYRQQGIAKKFLKDLYNSIDKTLILSDVVSDIMYETMNKLFNVEEIERLDPTPLNAAWHGFDSNYGDFKIVGSK